jgi:hypothetical protein
MNKNQPSDIVKLTTVQIEHETFYKISNSEELRPFFMSIVSHSNHWMFISSNGGLTAGRKNADYALFPYYTDDKITESSEITGSKSIFIVRHGDQLHVWEPFSIRQDGLYNISQNLYKNSFGNKILFEEVNHDLKLTFRYQWNSSDLFGFVKKSTLINQADHSVDVSLVDGIQNILPAGVGSDLQNSTSNLVDAYKRSELIKEYGFGIYALSAFIVDKAEPSESLKATIAWSLGLEHTSYLLSSLQIQNFRKRRPIHEEVDIKAEKGAYFIHANLSLSPHSEKEWMIMADVNKTHSVIAALLKTIKEEPQLAQLIHQDIELGTRRLIELNAAADGLQLTADHFRDTRHLSNVLFNIMRGGIFDNNYQIEKQDFKTYLSKANKEVAEKTQREIEALQDEFSLSTLKAVAFEHENMDFRRLCLEYMPLKFSRRHGDPSRPWNKFSINTRSEVDGSKILDYEGNWRDIFQNWEALAHSFPAFAESMIHKFLNATTFDGYNPYRVTKDGFDWETIEEDDPWSYIGYWGDHQIIYLLKFLEFIESHNPGRLATYFEQDVFVYANVPYKIKSYQEILSNPKDTIDFDHELDERIRTRRASLGADGALVCDEQEQIHRVNFLEKILATTLAKVSNLIPEGGIWMNTQRPEWNDANNALVGNGVSMVTLYYLRRFFTFLRNLLADSTLEGVKVSNELVDFYKRVRTTLEDHQDLLNGSLNDEQRKLILDELGEAASDFRLHMYKQGLWGRKRTISLNGLKRYVDLTLRFLDHSIVANKRWDQLYHAYNLMTVTSDRTVSISYLNEMLEGQVAVLSSGYLPSEEVLQVLDALKNSALFRDDQYSYLLYPNKDLAKFIEKNTIPSSSVQKSKLLQQLVQDGHRHIIEMDVNGDYHFNGNFNNANDLKAALNQLTDSKYSALAQTERQQVLDIFEAIFNHKSFTGRSGTFYGYEGLGSIYWHMVSKLALAVQECCIKAIRENANERTIGKLLEHYYEIIAGIGVHKPASLYGAFPTDPYSHTPAGKGAQQPGMTGQVKEDILCRFGELGVFIEEGKLHFMPCLLKKDEFLRQPQVFEYVDIHKNRKQIQLQPNSLAFTICQVPVIYHMSNDSSIKITFQNNKVADIPSSGLDQNMSHEIFDRTGNVEQIIVQINESSLK